MAEDPIAHFKAVAKERTEKRSEEKREKRTPLGTISFDEALEVGEDALEARQYPP